IYAQRLNAGGAAQWTASGLPICNSAQDQSDPQIVLDDVGGAIIVWSDRRSGAQDIYAQRVAPDGTPSWTANGVAVCTASNNQWYPRMVSDGAGGAIITWVDYRSGTPNNTDVYAQRIDAAGVVQWTADGVAICTPTSTQFPPTIATDGNGGAIITWHSAATPVDAGDIYAQRVNSAGAVQWTANGVAVCTDPSDQSYPVIVSDGSNGAIIVWSDQRGEWDLYAQRVNSAGAVQWNPAGVAVCAAAGAQFDATYPGIIRDGLGGAIVTWGDLRSGSYDVYAQRMSGAGAAQWTADGVAVCTATEGQEMPAIVQDGSGGAIISWFDGRSGNLDIYAQRLSMAGSPQWTPDGVAVCTAAGDQAWPVMFANDGGAVVVWDDRRSGRDIYAQRIQSDGQVVSFTVNSTADVYVTGTLRSAIAQANAIVGPQVIRFDIPGAGPHVIDVMVQGLPAVTDALTIDGFTQPGASPNTNPFGSPSNAQIKIQISGSSFAAGLHFQALGTLRGVAISGFNPACVLVEAAGVAIEGNYIGTDASGLAAGANPQVDGIRILAPGACLVGGVTPAARNVICNSLSAGIQIDGAGGVEVYGNYIGVRSDAISPLSNWSGVRIMNGATNARVGSSSIAPPFNPAEGNLIMGNTHYGVLVEGSGTISNAIVGNTMVSNTMGLIDLGADGFDVNDAGDGDTGPNQRQNYPEFTSAVGNQITGTMTGAPYQPLFLHFYWSPACCIQAAHFIGGATIHLNASGSASFAVAPPAPVPPGTFINATATDMFGNTSEVSVPIQHLNTSSGPSQLVNLVDANGAIRGRATFDNVNTVGNTFVENPYTPPVPVSGYSIGSPNDPQIYFNIFTDALYTGGVDVCLSYDENSIPGPEEDLALLHYDGSMWVDVTTSRDPWSNEICGRVTSLSPFVIGAITATAVDDTPLPESFALHANVPNPFNPITTIAYDIPDGGANVNITIYDVAGRRVRTLVDEHRPAGVFSVQWNGDDDRGQRVASGVYFYRMRAGAFVDTKKMVLLK
ncbi:MAG TPA: FlgD immunoglobulin-like domain containing protein, partial [Candidatus Krumholzibacteria bacterium]|nr:FlgD immunoglobulin-like domain containing protein [Candidatus Krumholzibacteria bacterium]